MSFFVCSAQLGSVYRAHQFAAFQEEAEEADVEAEHGPTWPVFLAIFHHSARQKPNGQGSSVKDFGKGQKRQQSVL